MSDTLRLSKLSLDFSPYSFGVRSLDDFDGSPPPPAACVVSRLLITSAWT
ncbi:hypothetical protein [Singulisphaera acidiphila]|nr:hypothetical protein [Singulisphaera acidiphila]